MVEATEKEMPCKYCSDLWDDAAACASVQPGRPHYDCTRNKGHQGDHVACGVVSHSIARWSETGSQSAF
jgi:hypothetical protein